MKAIMIFCMMLFLHVFADYNLQGILASMKQKDWWKKQINRYEESAYKNDYKAALLAHAFQWAFVLMLPLFADCWLSGRILPLICYATLLIVNCYFHYIIDDAKANKKELTLVADQILHLGQIAFTWILWTFIVGGWGML